MGYKCFVAHDKERFGSLSMAEASQALEHLQLVPKTREEQDDIRVLFAEADKDDEGRLDLTSFQALWLCVEEQLQMLQYEAGLDYALSFGFSESEARELWRSYDELLDDKVSNNNQETQCGQEGSTCQNDFRAFIETQAETHSIGYVEDFIPATTRGTVTATTRGTVTLSRRPTWSSWTLRRALKLLKLPKGYIKSLAHGELIGVLADYFGLVPEDDNGGPAQVAAHLAMRLGIYTSLELHQNAQALYMQMTQIQQIPSFNGRDVLAAHFTGATLSE